MKRPEMEMNAEMLTESKEVERKEKRQVRPDRPRRPRSPREKERKKERADDRDNTLGPSDTKERGRSAMQGEAQGKREAGRREHGTNDEAQKWRNRR